MIYYASLTTTAKHSKKWPLSRQFRFEHGAIDLSRYEALEQITVEYREDEVPSSLRLLLQDLEIIRSWFPGVRWPDSDLPVSETGEPVERRLHFVITE
jgi:hypothetical protein